MRKKVDIVSSLLSMDCEEALRSIFLSLDGSSMAACSRVCKSWNKFIRQRVWGCSKVRPALEAKLRQQWKTSKPTVLTKQISGKSQGFDIVADDELTLVGMADGYVKVIRNERPSRGGRGQRDEEEGSTVFTLDCRTPGYPFRLTIQYCLGSEVIVTVGNGLVQCWNRLTGTREYKRAHHEEGDSADVYGVTVLRSGIVATGADRGEVVLLHKKEKWWKWLETGKDEGPIWSVKARLVTEDRGQVNHMHTDPGCNHTAIGTQRAITLWDLEEGRVVEGSKVVNQFANMLVYIQPHAFVLNRQNGVGVWNMMTGDHVKHINIDVRLKGIGTNGREVILNTAYYCQCGYCVSLWSSTNFGSKYILVFDASELSDPNVPAENVRWRELLHSGEVGNTTSNVEAAINSTGIVAVFPMQEKQRQRCATTIKTLEFWRAESATEEHDERNSLGKLERERIRNSRRREATKEKKKTSKEKEKYKTFNLFFHSTQNIKSYFFISC